MSTTLPLTRVPAPPITRRRERWIFEAPAVLALVGISVLQAVVLLIGHRTYFAAPDNTTQFFAWYQKASAVLHAGGFPLWDQNTLSGHSFVGETQTGVFYPLNLIWLLVFGSGHGIGPHALDMLVVAHLLLASVGFYAFARSFGVSRSAALIAGVVFAYTGTVYARATGQTAIFFGLCLVPWALFFAHRQLETRKLRYAVGAGAAIGLGVLAGHFQPPFHAAVLVALLYLLTLPGPQESWQAAMRSRLTGALTTFGVAALVAAPQLVYSLPYLSRAYRFIGPGPPVPPGGSVSFQTFTHLYAGAPDSVLSLLDPQKYVVPDGNELFIGLSALAVLLVGGVAVRGSIRAQMGRYRIALLVSFAVGCLAMLAAWTWFPAVLYALPFVTEVRELARYSIMVHVFLCLLLAFTLEGLAASAGTTVHSGSWPRRRILGALGGFILADGIYLLFLHAPGSGGWFGLQVLLAGLTVLALSGWPRLKGIPLYVVLGLLIVASSLQNANRTLGSTSSPLYPARYFTRTPAITYTEQTCAGHRTLVLDGALPVNVGDVFRQLRTQNGYGATMQKPYYQFITASAPTSPEQTRLLDLRCIVTINPIALPGYRVGYRQPGGPTVYVDTRTSALNTPTGRPISARPIALADRRVAYSFMLRRSTAVVLSAIVYPGWVLRLDGRQVHSGAFTTRGVAVFPETIVSSGRHTLDYSWSGWP